MHWAEENRDRGEDEDDADRDSATRFIINIFFLLWETAKNCWLIKCIFCSRTNVWHEADVEFMYWSVLYIERFDLFCYDASKFYAIYDVQSNAIASFPPFDFYRHVSVMDPNDVMETWEMRFIESLIAVKLNQILCSNHNNFIHNSYSKCKTAVNSLSEHCHERLHFMHSHLNSPSAIRPQQKKHETNNWFYAKSH